MSSRKPPTLERSPAMRRILEALKKRDLTQGEISERAFIAATSLQRGGYIKAMLDASLIHVCAWNPPLTSGNWTPVYRYGPGENATKPPAAGNTEYARRWRHKTGADMKKIRRQMAHLTPERFTVAGQLGLST